MSGIFLLVLTVLTSAGAYVLGRYGLGHEAPFGLGFQRTLETVGLAVAFFLVNVSLAAAGILLLRILGWFVSLYVVTDYTVIALSSLQAVLFQHWRHTSKNRPSP